ncbi:large ribosomal subunit protein eL29-like [Rattus norvegicus]|uniref:large ribosomal subunit protein eL29-like n=1 Tax=Rattus norvegicus TaxID=10116 RepID=UPI0000DA2CE0|nr:60S ribosomal protein L29-like [Rattus norvegicus]
MHFAKKHNKEGLKKMQANNAKTLSACADAIKALGKSKSVKPKMPRAPVANSAVFLGSLGSGFEAMWPRIIDAANQSTRLKAEASAPVQAPKSAQASVKSP